MTNRIYVKVEYLSIEGKAPTEQIVDIMYANLKNLIDRKYKDLKEVNEEQSWHPAVMRDDMMLTIVKTLDIVGRMDTSNAKEMSE